MTSQGRKGLTNNFSDYLRTLVLVGAVVLGFLYFNYPQLFTLDNLKKINFDISFILPTIFILLISLGISRLVASVKNKR
jgi:hypothetical protein